MCHSAGQVQPEGATKNLYDPSKHGIRTDTFPGPICSVRYTVQQDSALCGFLNSHISCRIWQVHCIMLTVCAAFMWVIIQRVVNSCSVVWWQTQVVNPSRRTRACQVVYSAKVWRRGGNMHVHAARVVRVAISAAVVGTYPRRCADRVRSANRFRKWNFLDAVL